MSRPSVWVINVEMLFPRLSILLEFLLLGVVCAAAFSASHAEEALPLRETFNAALEACESTTGPEMTQDELLVNLNYLAEAARITAEDGLASIDESTSTSLSPRGLRVLLEISAMAESFPNDAAVNGAFLKFNYYRAMIPFSRTTNMPNLLLP